MALSKQDINLEDAIDIREIKNIKLLIKCLRLEEKLSKIKNSKLHNKSTTTSAD